MAKNKYKLLPITKIRSWLRYVDQNIEGSINYPFLAEPALERLNNAATILNEESKDSKIELLIWDAYRTRDTQDFIFNQYLNKIR